MAKRSGTSIYTTKYDRFRGVDFATDPALVDASRSPWAPNMMADKGGMPEKRPGWRVLHRVDGRINGLFRGEFEGEEHLLCHAGESLYRWHESAEEPEKLMEGLLDDRSVAVYMEQCLWIFAGNVLICYDGESAKPASDGAYVPITVYSRSPETQGGISYEDVNMLTPRQRVRFCGDGKTKVYQLPYETLDSADVIVRTNINGNGWEEVQTGWTADAQKGTVTFEAAPVAPLVGVEDNVEIEFSKTVEGYSDRVNKCRQAIVWGAGGAADRIVATGNPDYPNLDFICGFKDGAYWPAKQYFDIGTEETAIMGYRRWGENLAIIKEDNGQDSTVFLRAGALNSEGGVIFTVKPCISGAGAVSRFGFGGIGDEQLYLTGGGIYALTNHLLTAERVAQNRSFRVDPKLTHEDLTEAVSCSFMGSYLVFVGGRVYGIDGVQAKSYPSKMDTEFLYECFYWENVPARCVLRTLDSGKESLFFGTEDGRICRFNTDVDDLRRFSDGADRNLEGGEAITAMWSTRADDDGDPMVLKTMLKKGNAVTLKPYNRSSAQILLRTDKDAVAWKATEGTMDIFSWEDIDFSRFTFNSNDAPSEIPFNRKVKNYKRLQFVVKNDAINEGFGVYAIVKHYVRGNFAKR